MNRIIFEAARLAGAIVAVSLLALAAPAAADAQSWAVPGAEDMAGRKVLTFIAKDPPGQRCNNNLQVAAEIANAYRVPIQLIPASYVPSLPAPAVFYGRQLIAADGKDFNGLASYQMIADVLEVESADKQPRNGLLFHPAVRSNFDTLKTSIKSGGK
jgi:hypothetical protein